MGVDIFQFADRIYLLTVCYLTGFFEVDRLQSKSIADVIYCLKQHFCRHGLPETVMSDCQPFNAAEFARFAQQYEFTHVTSSPRYPQSNGRVENAIKTCKRLMTRALAEQSDPLLSILEWRNTAAEHSGGLSPAQLLFGRRTRTRLPTVNRLLETSTSAAAQDALHQSKRRQARYYNRGAKERPPLPVGQTVRIKDDPRNSDWKKGEIVDVLPHRSYQVRMEDGTTRRRTSRHVRFSAEPKIQE